MKTCNGLFEIKPDTIPAVEIFSRIDADLLQRFGQSLHDTIKFNGNGRDDLIMKVVQFHYFRLTHKEMIFTTTCPP